MMIRIILVDDHQMIIEGFKSILIRQDDIEVVGEALDGNTLFKLLEEKPADIVVLDLDLPNMDGADIARHLKQHYPNVKILVLTGHDDEEHIQELIEEGVAGYILKNSGIKILVDAIRSINKGNKYIGQDILNVYLEAQNKKKAYMNGITPLTKREKEVLKHIGNGLSTREISNTLFIAHSTVETHRRNLIDKLGVRNTKELVKYAVEKGMTNN